MECNDGVFAMVMFWSESSLVMKWGEGKTSLAYTYFSLAENDGVVAVFPFLECNNDVVAVLMFFGVNQVLLLLCCCFGSRRSDFPVAINYNV